MPHALRLLTLLLPLLAGCPLQARPTPPKIEVVKLPVRQYVPVPPELRKRCDWPKRAPLKDVVEVSRQRRACLEQYESQFDGIDKLQPQG